MSYRLDYIDKSVVTGMMEEHKKRNTMPRVDWCLHCIQCNTDRPRQMSMEVYGGKCNGHLRAHGQEKVRVIWHKESQCVIQLMIKIHFASTSATLKDMFSQPTSLYVREYLTFQMSTTQHLISLYTTNSVVINHLCCKCRVTWWHFCDWLLLISWILTPNLYTQLELHILWRNQRNRSFQTIV